MEETPTGEGAGPSFWRRVFHGPPRSADWLVPLSVVLAYLLFAFVNAMRSEAPYFEVLPAHVADIRNILTWNSLARLVSQPVLAAIPVALVLASRRCNVRRAALVASGIMALALLLGSGWLLPLAERHRHDVVTRIDAETLRDAGVTDHHEPLPLSQREHSWTLPQKLRAAFTGMRPDGSSDSMSTMFARMEVSGLALGLACVALSFLVCWPSRRLRLPWPVILALMLFPMAFQAAAWRLFRPWLMKAMETGEIAPLNVAVQLAPFLLVGGGVFVMSSRYGAPRCDVSEAPLLTRWERRALAAMAWLSVMVLTGGSLSSASLVKTATNPQAQPAGALTGAPAPAIAATTWIGLEKPPTLDSLHGETVLLDFWGTWCGPCVRAMPRVQQLQDELGPLGLRVLALTYEDAETVKPFLAKGSYTLPVGCDTEQVSVKAWKVKSWPTTYLIGRDGSVRWKGDPSSAERVILRELGLPGEACDVLKEASAQDAARAGWALAHLSREAPADLEASSCAEPGAASGKLRAWARSELRRSHALRSEDVSSLLARGAHSSLVEQLALRGSTDEALAMMSASTALRESAAARQEELRFLASEAVISERWVLGPRFPRDQRALWNELALSGLRKSCEGSGMQLRTLTVTLDGRELTRPQLRGHAHDRMAQALVAEDLAIGRAPGLSDLDARADAELARIAREADLRHGWR